MDLHSQMQLTVLASVAAGLATLAAIVLPGNDLGWPRLVLGLVVCILASVGSAWVLTRHFKKEN
ncbi:hypothetical protein [Streptomyces sp. NPDC096324]|uniref:hypothetical protein n=1 Tax=Streptomyces sp. NPDC096324 TaxID=3366085 RepID=UPI00380E8F60